MKIERIFNLFDDSDQGYLSPKVLENMLIHIEKIFAKENLCFEHPNQEIMYFNAEKRGSQNFKFIMSMINHKKKP